MLHLEYTYNDVKQEIESRGGKLLSTEYKNNKEPLEVLCLKCNKIWASTFESILKDHWCRCRLNPVNMNLVGQKFNHLTVIGFNGRTDGRTYFDCKCDCENDKIIRVREDGLKSGGAKSCGCTRSENLAGLQFGKLTVLSKVEKYNKKNHKKIFCECICICGRKVVTRASRLKYNSACRRCAMITDISGNIYGKLTALSIDYGFIGKARWFCQCECGNIPSIKAASLINGLSRSCGCCRLLSENELLDAVQNFLGLDFEVKRHYHADFLGQQHVDGAVFYNGALLFCIEYDGKQHFEPIPCWGGEKGFVECKERDRDKDIKCKENNIPLIRFPYNEDVGIDAIVKRFINAGIAKQKENIVVVSGVEIFKSELKIL